jgi:hypothetical protein
MTCHGFVTRLTQRVSLVERELLTLPEHQSSLPVFSGVRGWEMLPSVLQKYYQGRPAVTTTTTKRSVVARYVRTILQE